MAMRTQNLDKAFRSALQQLARVSILLVLLAFTAFAHEGKPHHPRDLLYTWGLDPIVLVSLGLSGWLYFWGVRRVWREAGTGRAIKKWEAAAYAGGWAAMLLALVSPLHPLGEVLFSAHMTQHELLMLVAAPLTVLGKPVIAFLWALPMQTSRSLGRAGQNRKPSRRCAQRNPGKPMRLRRRLRLRLRRDS